MALKRSSGLPAAILLLASLGAVAAGAQTTSAAPIPASRLAGDWRSTPPLRLVAGQPPLSQAGSGQTGTDLGAAPPSENLDRMLLLLAPSAAQREALPAELASMQNPQSPQYHQWLTPPEFAAQYGNSAADAGAVAAWLESAGFQVAPLPAGRGWIEFSGTVAQVEQAFHAQIDLVAGASGAARPVLMSAISVPAALAPVIDGLVSLDGIVSTPAITAPQPLSVSAPDLAAETSPGSAEALTPRLMAQLVDLAPLTSAGVTGGGQTIAIAARSNVNTADVTAFRAAFGLPALSLAVAPNGANPGLTDGQAEATLAASWAGAAAPGAKILLVPAATTDATDGVDLSLAAIVDGELAGTAAVGFSACEAAMSAAHQAFYAAVYRQAAAEGMAIVAAAGDSGAAGCALPGSAAPVRSGYGVNALASTAWNTAVGVAGFGSAPAAGSSALAAWSPLSTASPAYAGGGGGSTLYRIPVWQPDAVRLPGSPGRLLPDLSLPTAIDAGSNPGLAFCLSGAAASGSSGCTLVRSGGSGAAASLFAGVAALMAQKHGAEGNLAPRLYAFSQQPGVFNDVEQGTAQLQCAPGSSGCGANGLIGFTAGAGYDLATGLGVPDANALVAAEPQQNGTEPVIVTNTIAPGQVINPSGSVVLSTTVTSGTGGAAPTGTVTFYDSTTGNDIITVSLTPGGGSSSTASQTVTGALPVGTDNILVQYNGDTTYAATSPESPVSVQVALSATTTAVTPATNTPSAGSRLVVTAVVTSANAGAGAVAPSQTVTFYVDGQSQGSSQLVAGQASGASTNSSTSITINTPYTAGTHQITGVYNGDTNYNPSPTSPAATINVGPGTPAVVLTPATTTPGVGGSDALNVTITPQGSGAGAPLAKGTVTFTLDGGVVDTAQVIPGTPSTASFTLTNLTLGTHVVQATYNDTVDSNYESAASAQVTLTVGKMGNTLTVTPATATPPPNSSLQVTATLTPTTSSIYTPSQPVTFTLNGNVVGTGSLTPNGTGGFNTSTSFTVPGSGTYTLAATFPGDSDFAASTAPAVTITITLAATTTLVIPSTYTPGLGQTLPVKATITPTNYGPAPPSGSLTFTVDGTPEGGAQTVTPGTPSSASATLPAIPPGSHTLSAMYSGDGYYAASTAAGVTVTVPKIQTSITFQSVNTTPTGGSSLPVTVNLTAVSGGPMPPSGSVTFTLDGTTFATPAVTATSPTTATATATIAAVPGGTHVLAASYGGDSYYAASTSPVTVTLNASKSPTTITISPSTLTPSAGSSLAVTADILSSSPGSAAPTGTVSIAVDGLTAATGTVVSGTPSVATINIPLVSAGSHLLVGTYSGDGDYTGSTSAAVQVVASKGATVTTVTAAPPSLSAGVSETLTASIAPATPAAGVTYTITGTVSFYDGSKLLGQVSVGSNTATLSGVTLANNVSHSILAVYSGDGNWVGSSGTLPLAATTLPVNVVLTANYSVAPPGAAIILTVTVTPTNMPLSGSELNPTGTVVFYNGTTVIGTATLTPVAINTSSTATLITQTLPGGQDALTAYYEGDLYYDAATSNTLSLTVQAFTIAACSGNATSNVNIVQGEAGTACFNIGGQGGFDNVIQVECQAPAQDNLSCTASPQQLTPPGTVTFVVQTFSGPLAQNKPAAPLWPRAAGGTALAGLLLFLLPCGRRARIFVGKAPRRWLILLFLLVGLGGSGIGCTSNNALASIGTPLGVATLKVTAQAYINSTVVSQSAYFTVNVETP